MLKRSARIFPIIRAYQPPSHYPLRRELLPNSSLVCGYFAYREFFD